MIYHKAGVQSWTRDLPTKFRIKHLLPALKYSVKFKGLWQSIKSRVTKFKVTLHFPAHGSFSRGNCTKRNWPWISSLRVTGGQGWSNSLGSRKHLFFAFVFYQFSTENPTRLHSPGSVGTGQLEKLWAELPGYHHVAQPIDYRSWKGERKKSKTMGHSLPKQTSEWAAPGEQCQTTGVPPTAGCKWGSHPNGRRERAAEALLQPLTTAIGSMLFQEKRKGFNHSSEDKEKLLLKFLSYSGIIVRGNPAEYMGRNPESFRV